MRILLLGCSGFIGRELVPQLLVAGHNLTLVSRIQKKEAHETTMMSQIKHLTLDPSDQNSWQNKELVDSLRDAEAVINLAGEPIAEKRWSQTHLKKLEDSRICTTKGLINTMNNLRKPPKLLINASAIGYYGNSASKVFTESSSNGTDFLASLCEQWEKAASTKPRSTRLLILRIGIVIGADGGALGKMLPIFKAGLGGPIGDGQQWMSWISRSDLCEMILKALISKNWSGIVNAVAPEPVSMMEFANTLGKCLGRPSLLAVPAPILKWLLGDGARVVLEGQKVTSDKLNKLGFKFKYPTIKSALQASINSNTIN